LSHSQRTGGFTLVEALVTLLVLSVGLLGLGQLQVRLWLGSSDLHATTQAWLLAHNLMEVSAAEWLATPSPVQLSPPSAENFSIALSQSRAGAPIMDVTDTRLTLAWQRPSGARSLVLEMSRAGLAPVRDARWLLPAPR
jgi:Tfp pilus assembly protein PilV